MSRSQVDIKDLQHNAFYSGEPGQVQAMLDSNAFQAQTGRSNYSLDAHRRYQSNLRSQRKQSQMNYFIQRNPYNTPINLLKLNDRRLSPTMKLGQNHTRQSVADAYQAPRLKTHEWKTIRSGTAMNDQRTQINIKSARSNSPLEKSTLKSTALGREYQSIPQISIPKQQSIPTSVMQRPKVEWVEGSVSELVREESKQKLLQLKELRKDPSASENKETFS